MSVVDSNAFKCITLLLVRSVKCYCQHKFLETKSLCRFECDTNFGYPLYQFRIPGILVHLLYPTSLVTRPTVHTGTSTWISKSLVHIHMGIHAFYGQLDMNINKTIREKGLVAAA